MSEIFQKYYGDLADAIKDPARLASQLSSGSNPVISSATRDRVLTMNGSAYEKACVILSAVSGRLTGDEPHTAQCETLRIVCRVMMADPQLKPLARKMSDDRLSVSGEKYFII